MIDKICQGFNVGLQLLDSICLKVLSSLVFCFFLRVLKDFQSLTMFVFSREPSEAFNCDFHDGHVIPICCKPCLLPCHCQSLPLIQASRRQSDVLIPCCPSLIPISSLKRFKNVLTVEQKTSTPEPFNRHIECVDRLFLQSEQLKSPSSQLLGRLSPKVKHSEGHIYEIHFASFPLILPNLFIVPVRLPRFHASVASLDPEQSQGRTTL
mmetsp:Transcript_2321/g.3727  ORF Transcript_2321/g.3727 Transcript_2321/m.3727 type:complete len:209 (+) Transcript_2321:2621-3247(+)